MKNNYLICSKCGKQVAKYKGSIEGITTWFATCSECLYGVKGWKRGELDKLNKKKKCLDCGKQFEYADMHYFWDTKGRHCRG